MKMRKRLFLLLALGFFLSAFVISDHPCSGAFNAGQSLDGNRLLIVTTSKYAKVLDRYIDWKTERGLDVELDIQSAEKGAEAIQRKIREKYDHGGLTYIVLVGDIDDVPSVMLPGSGYSPYRKEGYPSDPSYTLLAGDDLIGDALISRISVNTPAELENQLNKIITYEKGDFTNFDWIRHAVVASMTGFDGVDHAGKLEKSLKSHPEYFDEVIKIMESDSDITGKLRDAIEKTGVNFIAHHGHGSETAFGSLPFSREDAAGLKNFDTGFPIIHGAACSTGSFWIEDGDCLAEAFMKAGTVEKPAGAIAFLGGATSMDPGACIAAQKEVFMKYYFDEDVDTIGELFYRGTLAAMKNLSEDRGERLFRRWHLFGDCSTPLWRKIPCDYLGQELPGDIPVKFAPGIVSTDEDDSCCEVSVSGDEIVFSREMKIYVIKRGQNGVWSTPVPLPFSGGEPSLSKDGKKIYFNSRDHFPGAKVPLNVWVARKSKDDRWDKPSPLGQPVTNQTVHAPSAAGNGNIYASGLIRLKFIDGKYLPPEPLKPAIKGYHPFISADESFMIFDKRPMIEGNPSDLFITFRRSDDAWTEPVRLGEAINTSAMETNASVTPDGKYMFFTRKFDVYWVKAGFIEKIKNQVLE